MGEYRKLDVWRRSHQVTLAIYRLTGTFPRSEQYGLVAQLRRAAASIPANIAEGCGRNTPKDTARILRIALASANEADYWIILSRDLGYLHPDQAEQLGPELAEIRRMLASLIRSIAGSPRTDTK